MKGGKRRKGKRKEETGVEGGRMEGGERRMGGQGGEGRTRGERKE